MPLEIREEPFSHIAEYATIPIRFTVRRILEPAPTTHPFQGIPLLERDVLTPYEKDYDQIPGNSPIDWLHTFETSHWGMLAAFRDGVRVGGAIIAHRCSQLFMLEGRDDLAVLWDIRMAEAERGNGVGTAMFREAVRWAVSRHCTLLKIETQNINLPACHFYMKQGCTLGAINRFAYPDLPDELQLFWYKSVR